MQDTVLELIRSRTTERATPRRFQFICLALLALVFIEGEGFAQKLNPGQSDPASIQDQAFERLNNTTPYGIEILHAGPAYDHPESIFGHMAIRLLVDPNHPSDDPVVNMGVDSKTAEISRIKSVFGGYSLKPIIVSTQAFILSNGYDRRRQVTRIILPSTPDLRRRLVAALTALYRDSNQRYFFFSNNCTSALQRVLRAAGFPWPKDLDYFPGGIETYMMRTGLTPAPPVEIINPTALDEHFTPFLDRARVTDLEKEDSVSFWQWFTLFQDKIKKSGLILEARIHSPPATFEKEDPQLLNLLNLPQDIYDSRLSIHTRWNPVFRKYAAEYCETRKQGLAPELLSSFRWQEMPVADPRVLIAAYEENCGKLDPALHEGVTDVLKEGKILNVMRLNHSAPPDH